MASRVGSWEKRMQGVLLVRKDFKGKPHADQKEKEVLRGCWANLFGGFLNQATDRPTHRPTDRPTNQQTNKPRQPNSTQSNPTKAPSNQRSLPSFLPFHPQESKGSPQETFHMNEPDNPNNPTKNKSQVAAQNRHQPAKSSWEPPQNGYPGGSVELYLDDHADDKIPRFLLPTAGPRPNQRVAKTSQGLPLGTSRPMAEARQGQRQGSGPSQTRQTHLVFMVSQNGCVSFLRVPPFCGFNGNLLKKTHPYKRDPKNGSP